jgi:hypothetical protein
VWIKVKENSILQLGITSNKIAFACECIEPKEPAQPLSESKTVFSGKVVKIDVQPENYVKIVKFDVERAWKGISTTTVTAVTGANGGSCGFPFEEGKEYLVYSYDSYGSSKSLIASMCSRTALLSEAQNDLMVLGPGYVPTQSEVDVVQETTKSGSTFPVAYIVGTGAAIAGLVAYLTLRKRVK